MHDNILIKPTFQKMIKAAGVLTSDNTQVTTGKIVTIGSRVYTFRTTLSTAPTIANEIKIGADADGSLTNLKHAINGTGAPLTNYSVGTNINTQVSSSDVAAHALTITALNPGFAGNQIISTEDDSHLSWAFDSLVGGRGGELNLTTIRGTDSTLVSDPIDVGQFEGLIAYLITTAHGGSSPTLDVAFESSPDGERWFDPGTDDDFTQVTETDGSQKLVLTGFPRYIRAKVTLAGTAPKYAMSLLLNGRT